MPRLGSFNDASTDTIDFELNMGGLSEGSQLLRVLMMPEKGKFRTLDPATHFADPSRGVGNNEKNSSRFHEQARTHGQPTLCYAGLHTDIYVRALPPLDG